VVEILVTPAVLNFTIYKGMTFDPLIFNVKDASNNAIDLTNWAVFAKSRNSYGQLIDLQPVITNAATGQITISLSQTKTDSFTIGEQQWDMTFQRPDTTKIGPYITGRITVKDPVTHG